jgi:hypothetical protein
MAGRSITAANAVYMLSILPVFPIPVQLQGFSADDVFGTDVQTVAEVSMGVDGLLSAGFIFNAITQNITLQANSDSNAIFDAWQAAQKVAKDTFFANAVIMLRGIGNKWTLTNGVLTTYPPIPDAKKVLQPRRFGITWESVDPAPV